jgi:hypothetical protein
LNLNQIRYELEFLLLETYKFFNDKFPSAESAKEIFEKIAIKRAERKRSGKNNLIFIVF